MIRSLPSTGEFPVTHLLSHPLCMYKLLGPSCMGLVIPYMRCHSADWEAGTRIHARTRPLTYRYQIKAIGQRYRLHSPHCASPTAMGGKALPKTHRFGRKVGRSGSTATTPVAQIMATLRSLSSLPAPSAVTTKPSRRSARPPADWYGTRLD